jgi:nitrite reductase/ring-hydroxylating ferredoxin subunit
MTNTFHRVVAADELADGVLHGDVIAGWPVLVVRSEGQTRAMINRCTHAASAFAPGGRARRGVLMCPAHGARFRVEDGICIGSLYRALRTFECRETDGWIEVAVPDAPPGADEQPLARG